MLVIIYILMGKCRIVNHMFFFCVLTNFIRPDEFNEVILRELKDVEKSDASMVKA
jgi:hypothetical protein